MHQRICTMKYRNIASLVLAAAAALALSTVAQAVSLPSHLQIMPLGDSITDGAGGTNAGYRGPLYNLLIKTAPDFQFVGTSTYLPGSLPANQQHHNGFPSYATINISNNLDRLDTSVYTTYGGADRYPNGGYWLTGGNGTGRAAVFPNVILLMAGANDGSPGSQLSYRDNLTTLLSKIVTLRPDAHLIIADVTPRTDIWASSVPAINNTINAVAADYMARGSHVSVVDMNTSFPSNGLNDAVHPNDIGYNWMANQWYGAIVKSYETPEPGTLVLSIMGVLGMFAYARRKRK